MSITGQLETDVEIKASAKKFHEVFSCRPHHVANICPDKIHGVDLHEGDWGNSGSVISWRYLHGKLHFFFFFIEINIISYINYCNIICYEIDSPIFHNSSS